MIAVLVALAAAVPADARPVQADPPVVQTEAAAQAGTPLCDGAKVGMTTAQVKAAFPRARSVVDGESLLDNAKERFRLTGVRLPTGERATVRFYFLGDSLNEVKLIADVPPGQTQANVRRAAAIANSLAPIYGKPSTCGPRQGLLAYECDWVSHGLSVSVTYMDVAGQSPLLETAIRGIVASDAQVQHGTPVTKVVPADRSQGPGG
jgi:hypothetical protein